MVPDFTPNVANNPALEQGWITNCALDSDNPTQLKNDSRNGLLFDASFTGIEQWTPLQGMALSRHGQQVGSGLSALFGQMAMTRFDLGQRRSDAGRAGTALLWGLYRF